MPKFTVTVMRSAVNTAEIEVEARTQAEAEGKVSGMLDVAERVDLDALARKVGGVITCYKLEADDESDWEVS